MLTGERVNKPDAPREFVKVNEKSRVMQFSQRIAASDFGMQVGAYNGPTRWEAPFWFYVVPIPVNYDYLDTQPLSIEVALAPKSSQMTFNPWQIFFAGTNQVRVPPNSVWQDHKWLGTNATEAFSITNDTTFLFEFTPWKQVYPDRDLPFQILIDGITVAGRSSPVPPVTFRPTPHVRAGFKLPN